MPPKENEHNGCLEMREEVELEGTWIEALADYLIEFATPAFENKDRELLEKILADYFN